MKRPFTLDQLRQSACAKLNGHLFEEKLPYVKHSAGKKSKYGNKKTEANGITFDSQREANRYKELLLMQKAGLIGLIELQVAYELNEGGSHSLRYIADFRYIDMKTGETTIEDSKGMRTKEYLKKKRLMKKVHGIEIKET